MQTKPGTTKEKLFTQVKELISRFCTVNDIPYPVIYTEQHDNYGYYRPNKMGGLIAINIDRCRQPQFNPTPINQSFPGNKTDRTVAGVTAHEFGHYLDFKSRSTFNLRNQFKHIQEPQITSYDTTAIERVAEAVRLFVLNPGLLKAGRPKAYEILREQYTPVVELNWRETFNFTSEKYIHWCEKWINKTTNI